MVANLEAYFIGYDERTGEYYIFYEERGEEKEVFTTRDPQEAQRVCNKFNGLASTLLQPLVED